jgi:predicted NAD-dependent protein-ADP-ribosyltransferase YbiA (DUF1768 family)
MVKSNCIKYSRNFIREDVVRWAKIKSIIEEQFNLYKFQGKLKVKNLKTGEESLVKESEL